MKYEESDDALEQQFQQTTPVFVALSIIVVTIFVALIVTIIKY